MSITAIRENIDVFYEKSKAENRFCPIVVIEILRMDKKRILEAFIFSMPSVLLIAFANKFLEYYIFFSGVVLLFISGVVLFFFIRKMQKRYRPTFVLNIRLLGILFYSTLFSLFAAIGIAATFTAFPYSTSDIDSIEGTLIASPSVSTSLVSYKITVSKCSFFLPSSPGSNAIGSAKGVLSVTVDKKRALTEGVVIGSTLSFYDVSFKKGGVWAKGIELHLSEGKDVNYFYATLEKVRMMLRKWAKIGGETGGLMLALLDGERLFVDEALRRSYAKAGVSHLLALSGMHLGVISGIFLLICKPIIGRYLSLLAVSILSLFYSIFAGASPSLVRAVIMLFFITLSKYKGGKTNMPLVIALSLPISLLVQPSTYNSVALILSYLALSGIVVFEPFISKLLTLIFPKKIARPLGASCGATIATSWWTLATFGYVSSGGIIGALFLTPITFLLMALGFVSLFFWLIGWESLSFFVILLAKPVYQINHFLLNFFSTFPQIKCYFHLLIYFSPILVLIIAMAVINFYKKRRPFIIKRKSSL